MIAQSSLVSSKSAALCKIWYYILANMLLVMCCMRMRQRSLFDRAYSAHTDTRTLIYYIHISYSLHTHLRFAHIHMRTQTHAYMASWPYCLDMAIACCSCFESQPSVMFFLSFVPFLKLLFIVDINIQVVLAKIMLCMCVHIGLGILQVRYYYVD